MPIDIHLRLRHPRDALTILDVLGMQLDEASDALADDQENADWHIAVSELYDAVWTCLQAQGFSRSTNSNGHIFYQGRDLNLERDLSVQPIDAEGTLICLSPSKPRQST